MNPIIAAASVIGAGCRESLPPHLYETSTAIMRNASAMAPSARRRIDI